MSNVDGYKPIMLFVIKIAVLAGLYYYFSEQINLHAENKDIAMASSYSGGYAGTVLLLLLMFRWSGFFSRILAGLIGIGAVSAIIALYILNNGFAFGLFVGIYFGILAAFIFLAYLVLFKKV